MMIKQQHLALALIVLGASLVSGEADGLVEAEPALRATDKSGRPLVEVETLGHRVVAPVYEDIGGFTEKRLEFDRRTIGAFMDIGQNLTRSLIRDKKNPLFVVPSAVGKLISKAISMQGEFRSLIKTEKSPNLKDGYTKEMAGLMRRILKNKGTGEVLSNEETYERVNVLLESVKLMAVKSPTGLYIDWNELTIDGQDLVSYCAPVTAWFNKSAGYRMVLNGVSKLTSILENTKVNH